MIIRFYIFFICFLSGFQINAQTVIDRLVVDINATPFTHKQILKHMQIRHILNLDSHSNWDAQLHAFIADTIVDFESLSEENVQPPTRSMFEQFKLHIKDNLAQLEHYDQKELNTLLTKILRIEHYKRQKMQATPTQDAKIESWQNSEWFEKLKAKTRVRFYGTKGTYSL